MESRTLVHLHVASSEEGTFIYVRSRWENNQSIELGHTAKLLQSTPTERTYVLLSI